MFNVLTEPENEGLGVPGGGLRRLLLDLLRPLGRGNGVCGLDIISWL